MIVVRREQIMGGRKIFNDSVVAVPKQPGLAPNGMMVHPAGAVDPNQRMTLHFALRSPNEAELEAKVAAGTAVISPQELKERYSASSKEADTLVAWLKGQGFEIKDISPDYTSV